MTTYKDAKRMVLRTHVLRTIDFYVPDAIEGAQVQIETRIKTTR